MSKKMTIDGNTAASHIAYAFSEVAAIYPITPSSPMAESADEWAALDRRNIFGEPLRIAEMQSEGGAAGAVHGSLAAGALTTTFTASQGLLLMIPNMYKIAGELLPTVFHVSARALAAGALNIFGDHSDVMSCRHTGFAMLSSNSVQEVMDLALVAHLATLKSRVPFLHFFDGFRTSHEVAKIDVIDYNDIKGMVDMADVEEFRKRALNPEHPHQQGTAQNPDIYFQGREAVNPYYLNTPAIVKEMMQKVNKLTGRNYQLFNYVGAEDAERVIIMMGSGADAAEEAINHLVAKGEKVGLIKVRLFRPFSIEDFTSVLPATVKSIAVLDRTKEPGSAGEPLYQDVVTALFEQGLNKIKVVGGRYGLGSKEFTPSHVGAVLANLKTKKPKNHFTIGITDDVTNTSLVVKEKINASPEGTVRCKFYGLGSDGTVGANKNSIKIIGDHTDLFAQAYFVYDSKKSGGITVSHLRFGKSPIQSSYLIDHADFIACHNPSYVTRYDMVSDLKDGGVFVLNCPWSAEELDANLPATMKNQLAKKKAKLYIIDALGIAGAAGMGNRINGVMQAAFFKLADIIPYADAERYMKEAVKKSYGKKGDEVVRKNCDAIDNAIAGLIEVAIPADWATTKKGAKAVKTTTDEYYTNFIAPVLAQEGDKLPVSALNPAGVVPTGTTKYEKRGIAAKVPNWIPENCIQCNACSLVCPHSVIRPVLASPESLEGKPKSFKTRDAIGVKNSPCEGFQYRLQISPLDCSGCGACVKACTAKNNALEMIELAEGVKQEEKNYPYSLTLPIIDTPFKPDSVKGSQFKESLFEFSGACAGCGETPYIKLVTQLFGDRMIIANATGCTSIYGGSAPTCPYTKNAQGHGPAWANSLFEDNAEFGYGMNLAYKARRTALAGNVAKLLEKFKSAGYNEGVEACQNWLDNMNEGEGSKAASAALLSVIEGCKDCGCDCDELQQKIFADKDCLVKKSIWIFGGDGWAYDIGYGGLDHVLAMNEDVNILVLDTEVYSNTGGQASKATPTGSVAKFAASGKRTKKKDLGMMAMSYGYVYVAQVAMGADKNQVIKAIAEAEAYKGPSLVICYATCINHGIDMSNGPAITKDAVDSGYWNLYRYNPTLREEGKNPFSLDSKDPQGNYQDFINREVRYTSLKKTNPEVAEVLFKQAEEDAKERLDNYKRLAGK